MSAAMAVVAVIPDVGIDVVIFERLGSPNKRKADSDLNFIVVRAVERFVLQIIVKPQAIYLKFLGVQ